MSRTMRAVVLDAPGPPDALHIRDLPIPTPTAGEVLIHIKAFGLNRSELHKHYTIDDIAQAHTDMESGVAVGKLVVTPQRYEHSRRVM